MSGIALVCRSQSLGKVREGIWLDCIFLTELGAAGSWELLSWSLKANLTGVLLS